MARRRQAEMARKRQVKMARKRQVKMARKRQVEMTRKRQVETARKKTSEITRKKPSVGRVLLSFDVEEFDLPREYGAEITLEKGIKISKAGLFKILAILEQENVKATFFCTANFASAEPALIREIQAAGHEIACHGVDHFQPLPSDLENSQKILQKIIQKPVYGYRFPRMQPVDYVEMRKLGFLYDSSVNPTFIPGRYNHFRVPKTPFREHGVLEIPTSVATPLRIPLFWLALHLFPEKLYLFLAQDAIRKTGYFATYFHPWEFTNLRKFSVIPKYIAHSSGENLEKRFTKLVHDLKQSGYEFVTYATFVDTEKKALYK